MKLVSTPLLALLVIILFASGCKKDNTFSGSIKIIGSNLTMPACAPNFDAIWQSGAQTDSLVTISNTPASIGMNNNPTYPVYMQINWITNTPTCGGMITITSYKMQ